METGEPQSCQPLVDLTGRGEQGVWKDLGQLVCRVGEKRCPLRKSGELPFLDATDSGSLRSIHLLLCGSLMQPNMSQWEANPELSGDQQSLIDRFVKLRTVSEVCILAACGKVCSIELGFLHRTSERRCARWESFLGFQLNPPSKRSCWMIVLRSPA